MECPMYQTTFYYTIFTSKYSIVSYYSIYTNDAIIHIIHIILHSPMSVLSQFFPYLQLRGMTCMEGSSCPGSNSLELLPGGQKMEWSMIDEVV